MGKNFVPVNDGQVQTFVRGEISSVKETRALSVVSVGNSGFEQARRKSCRCLCCHFLVAGSFCHRSVSWRQNSRCFFERSCSAGLDDQCVAQPPSVGNQLYQLPADNWLVDYRSRRIVCGKPRSLSHLIKGESTLLQLLVFQFHLPAIEPAALACSVLICPLHAATR